MIKVLFSIQLVILMLISVSINAQDLKIIVTDVNHKPVKGVKVDVVTEYLSLTATDSLPNRFYLDENFLNDLDVEKPNKIEIIVSDLRKGKDVLYESDTSEVVNISGYEDGYRIKLKPKLFTYNLNIVAINAETKDTIENLYVAINDEIAKSQDSLKMRISLPTSSDLLNIDIKHPEYVSMNRYFQYKENYNDTIRVEMQKNRYKKRIYIREKGRGKKYVDPSFINREIIVAGPENYKDTVRTNAHGMAEFDFLLNGYHEFSISAIDSFKMEDIHSAFFNVGPKAFDFDDFIFLERKDAVPEIVFKGWLTNDAGHPLGKAKVTIDIEGHNDHHLTTDDNGYFSTAIAMDKFNAEFGYRLKFEKKYHKASKVDRAMQFITFAESKNLLVDKKRIEILRTHKSYFFKLVNWKNRMSRPEVIFWSKDRVHEAREKKLEDGVLNSSLEYPDGIKSRKDKPINTIDFEVMGPLNFECIFVVEKLAKNQVRYYLIEKELLYQYLENPAGKLKKLNKAVYKEYDGLKSKLEYLGLLK